MTTTKKKVLVLTGPGNNGGDGFATARLLQKNHDVTCIAATTSLRGDAATMAKKWQGTTLPLSAMESYRPLLADSLIIDGLFGTGLTRDLTGDYQRLIALLADTQSTILAIDIPSGIDSDSGCVLGSAIHAQSTITFFARKPCHLLQPGKAHSGSVHVVDITAKPALHSACLRHACTQAPTILRNHPLLWRDSFPRPQPQDHKYSRGVCAFYGASLLGAHALATNSALHSGCGMVIATTPSGTPSGMPPHMVSPCVVVRENADWLELLRDTRIKAYAMGHGMMISASYQKLLVESLAILRERNDKPVLILDGGALQAFIVNKLAHTYPSLQVILTPHHGEAQRCFPDIALDNKCLAAQTMARQTQAIVVLKGNDTVIAHATQDTAADSLFPVVINDHAPSSLAAAGSGDVLVGILASFCAAMPAPLTWQACLAGVYLHGEAAYLAQRRNPHVPLVASMLPRFLRQALARCAPTHYNV